MSICPSSRLSTPWARYVVRTRSRLSLDGFRLLVSHTKNIYWRCDFLGLFSKYLKEKSAFFSIHIYYFLHDFNGGLYGREPGYSYTDFFKLAHRKNIYWRYLEKNLFLPRGLSYLGFFT